jgi:hypothetical protein
MKNIGSSRRKSTLKKELEEFKASFKKEEPKKTRADFGSDDEYIDYLTEQRVNAIMANRDAEARKKAEETPAPLEVVDPEELPEETEPDTGENDELIKKAVQYFSEDLAEAIYEQRLKIEEEKSKLRKMEDDPERCKRILGFGKEAAKDDE